MAAGGDVSHRKPRLGPGVVTSRTVAELGYQGAGGGGGAVRHSVGFHLLPLASRLKCVLV